VAAACLQIRNHNSSQETEIPEVWPIEPALGTNGLLPPAHNDRTLALFVFLPACCLSIRPSVRIHPPTNLLIYLSTCLPTYQSTYLATSTYPPTYLSLLTHLPIHISTPLYLPIYLPMYTYLPTYLYLSIYLYIHLSPYPPIHPSIHPSIRERFLVDCSL
jgi:hypothetical protein